MFVDVCSDTSKRPFRTCLPHSDLVNSTQNMRSTAELVLIRSSSRTEWNLLLQPTAMTAGYQHCPPTFLTYFVQSDFWHLHLSRGTFSFLCCISTPSSADFGGCQLPEWFSILRLLSLSATVGVAFDDTVKKGPKWDNNYLFLLNNAFVNVLKWYEAVWLWSSLHNVNQMIDQFVV